MSRQLRNHLHEELSFGGNVKKVYDKKVEKVNIHVIERITQVRCYLGLVLFVNKHIIPKTSLACYGGSNDPRLAVD